MSCFASVSMDDARARLPGPLFEAMLLLRHAGRADMASRRFEAWAAATADLPLDGVCLYLNSWLAMYDVTVVRGRRRGEARRDGASWRRAEGGAGFSRAAAAVAKAAAASLAGAGGDVRAREVVLVYARLERRRERYAAAREAFAWLARVDGGGDGAAHGAAAALCAYHCGDYAGAIALAGADAALAHRFYLFHASAAPEGLALRRRAAETAAAKLRRTLRSAYDDVRVDDGQVVLAWLRSPGLGVLGPNPVIFDDAAIHCGRRGEGRGATRAKATRSRRAATATGSTPRDYAPERAAPEPVILVPASKPGNYYHCLLEFLARVARAVAAGVLPRGATLLVPANQCLALYAEALALLRVERWRPVDLTKALALPAGAWVLDGATVARTESRGLDAGACDAPRSLWDFYTPPRSAPRALRAALARPTAPTTAILIALFGAAGLVVGAHGAGLANLVFAAEGCRVLEFPVVGRANRTYEWLARALGHAYAAADAEATFTGALDLDDAAVADAAAKVRGLTDGSLR
ncbi:tetrapyrrole methylase [Aureococcus anophagefferens]|nr:tetrapyrrole methylase [Aureococcus anophagefferens]